MHPHDGLEERIFAVLEGPWVLSRTIPGHATMRGSARFLRLGPVVLQYWEEGELRLATGTSMPARRDWYWLLAPGHLRIAFSGASGGPEGTLHRLHLHPGQSAEGAWPLHAEDLHHCGQDTYLGRYHFENATRISIDMLVRGPSKHYAIHTVLTRTWPMDPDTMDIEVRYPW